MNQSEPSQWQLSTVNIVVAIIIIIIIIIIILFKNEVGMAIGPVDPWKTVVHQIIYFFDISPLAWTFHPLKTCRRILVRSLQLVKV